MQNIISINSINYTEEEIRTLIELWENNGYIISGKEIQGYHMGFTESYLNNIKNSNLDKLIEQFKIETLLNNDNIHSTGSFHIIIGNVIIYYNNELIDKGSAELILKQYIDNY